MVAEDKNSIVTRKRCCHLSDPVLSVRPGSKCPNTRRVHVRIVKRNGGCFHVYVWLFMNSRTKKNLSKQKYTLCCVGTLPKYNRKMVKRGEITNTQIHDSLFSWLGTCTSIQSRL